MNAHQAHILFVDRVKTMAEVVREAERTNHALRQHIRLVEEDRDQYRKQLLDTNDRLRAVLDELAEERKINTDYEVTMDRDRRTIHDLEDEVRDCRARIERLEHPLRSVELASDVDVDHVRQLQLFFPDDGTVADVSP